MDRYLTDRARKRRWWEIPVCGWSMLMGCFAVESWIEDSPFDEDFVIWLFANAGATLLVLLPLILIMLRHLRVLRARRIAEGLSKQNAAEIPLADLDRALGVKHAARKIADLLRHRYLQGMEMDGMALTLDNPAGEAVEETPQEPESDVIREIRRLNDEIDDEAVSAQIERVERATAGILSAIDARPERAADARRFMNYYLPATLKLLESYRLMEKQSYQGENIRASRQGIESVLEKLATATERQQDRLFRAEALDIETDIDVLETMMKADGLG